MLQPSPQELAGKDKTAQAGITHPQETREEPSLHPHGRLHPQRFNKAGAGSLDPPHEVRSGPEEGSGRPPAPRWGGHTIRPSLRPAGAHLVQEQVGVGQEEVRPGAEAAGGAAGPRLQPGRAPGAGAGRGGGAEAARGGAARDVVAQVMLAHHLHHRARPRALHERPRGQHGARGPRGARSRREAAREAGMAREWRGNGGGSGASVAAVMA